MKIIFDYDRLKNLIRNFYEITKASICIFDINYKPILAYPSHGPELCMMIKSTEKGNLGCINCDVEGCKAALRTKSTITYICHAGLCDTVTPIMYNDLILGYIMFGQVADNSVSKERFLQRIIDKCKKYNIEENSIKSAFNNISFLSPEYIDAASKILLSCTSYIYLSHLIKIERNMLCEEIIEFMENNYSQNITIDFLCNKYFISRNKLFNLFHKNYNITPLAYLTQIRMNKAKELLLSTDYSVSSISEMVNISDYNYFIKIFRNHTGMAPLKYRKTQKNLN